ncbi:MAG: NAD(P)-dependent glycerol-3-phosphate dehydrogenase [Acidimicrobiaceae bacterium]|nr:NAD(P)-dependent glycerol-3-phosphate dehydrogenase [Acidimicrobiaceae bacterium]
MAVVGAGSWGTTVASTVAQNQSTMLWARRAALAQQITTEHENIDYLRGVALTESLLCSSNLQDVVRDASIVMMAVPSNGFRDVLVEVAKYVSPEVPIVSLTKGLERDTLKRMSEVVADVLPRHCVAVLTGPNLAHEILAGQPAATVVGCSDDEIAKQIQVLLTRPTLRVYTNPDVVGCEIGGVVKNVIAIAAGIVEGMGFGDNSKATLITRGLAEMSRLGIALGANPNTFTGLAGIGDVVATCASAQSRNTAVGVRLGKGESIESITASMKMVAEGVKSSLSVLQLAQRCKVDMPITEQVAAVCEGTISARDSLVRLMSRVSKAELD